MKTPINISRIEIYDHLSPQEAVVAAWTKAGNNECWHRQCKVQLRNSMPLLARAIERLAENPPGPG